MRFEVRVFLGFSGSNFRDAEFCVAVAMCVEEGMRKITDERWDLGGERER